METSKLKFYIGVTVAVLTAVALGILWVEDDKVRARQVPCVDNSLVSCVSEVAGSVEVPPTPQDDAHSHLPGSGNYCLVDA